MAHILIIEDEIALAEAYAFLFRYKGHVVEIAYDGREGLASIKKKEPDLVVVDMMMPGLDGLGFLERYDTKKHPTVKILILSNMVSPQYEAKAYALGANRYEIKASLTPPQLLDIVDGLLASD